MNERIRMVREKCKLSRVAFGEKLGVSGDVINNLERGRVNIRESIIKLICSVYLVDETWLRTGEGEMFIQRSEDDELKQAIEAMLRGRNPNFKRRLISVLASLDESDWTILEKKVLELAEAARTEMDIAAEVASYEEELRLQAQVGEKSSVSGGQSGIGKAKMA